MQHRSVSVIVTIFLQLQGAVGQFSTFPSNSTTVSQGGPVRLECSYPNASNITWEREGVAAITDATPGFSMEDVTPDFSILRISSAAPQVHTGSYACVATLEGGGEERVEFTIMVQFVGVVSVEVIRDPCDGNSLYIGSTISLNCTVQDSAPSITSITWFKVASDPNIEVMTDEPRVNIMGAMLTFNGIISTDDGNYFCQASNGLMAVNSSMVLIGHLEPPVRILTVFQEGSTRPLRNEEEIFVKEGERTEVYCIVNAIHPLFHGPVWRIGSSGIVSGRGGYALIVISPCNFSLTIGATTTHHEGFYDCGIQGETLTSFRLSLARIPAIYRIAATPNTNSVGRGTTLTLRCFPDPPVGRGQIGNVEVIYSWQFVPSGGQAVEDVVASSNRTLGNGTLILRGLQFSDSGVYICVAGNDLVTPVRTNYSIDVEEVTIQPIAPLKLGFNVTLSCNVVGLAENISIAWTVGGSDIIPSSPLTSTPSPSSPSPRLTSTFDGTTSTLLIAPLTEAELGEVLCTVSHPDYLPVVATEQIIEVQEPYLIGDATGQKLYVRVGERIVLVCPLRSRSSSTTVSWFHGQLLLRSSNPDAVVTQAADGSMVATLGVASVNEDDGDVYECQVDEGRRRRILTYTVTIFVTVPAKLVDSPEDVSTVEAGAFFELRCISEGRPHPIVTWTFNGERIADLHLSDVREFENGTLIFDHVDELDSGEYMCTVMQANLDFTLVHSTMLRVEPKSSKKLSLSHLEMICVFTVVGAVSFFLLVVCLSLIGLCLQRKFMRHVHARSLESDMMMEKKD